MADDEALLVEKLRRLNDDYLRLNRSLKVAGQVLRFSRDPWQARRAGEDEQRFLREMNRLMDRMRAVEGQLLRVRGKLRPLQG
jgi:hypothetical protein